jgi:hypothetical protein
MRLTTFATAALLALLTFASPAFASSVSDVRVDNTVPSAAAGARTVYRVAFTTSPAGGLSAEDSIRVMVPAGTLTDEWQTGAVSAGDGNIGTCSVPDDKLTSTCRLFSKETVKGGTPLTVTLAGLTNGDAGTDKSVRVSTTQDTDSATSRAFTIVKGGTVSQPAVDISSPSAAAGARTTYVVRFKVSDTGGLSAEAGSTIDVGLPLDIGTDGWVGGTVRDMTLDKDVGTCGKPEDTRIPTSTCGFFSSASVAPGDELRITLRGLTNGGDPGAETVTVGTSSDLPAIASTAFEIGKGQEITQPSVAIDDPSAAGGARTRYVVDFKLSSSGGMSAEAGSEITLTLPPGTGTGGWMGGTVHDVTAKRDVGTCVKPDAKLVSTCGFFSASSVAAGDELQLILRGLENGDPGTGKTVTVRTTSDLPVVTSSGFEIVKGAAVSTPTVSIADPSAAAGARTRYVIDFTLSDTGGMSADANSRITVALPGDTGTNGWLGGTVRDVTTDADVGSCDKPDGQSVSSCGFFSGRSAAAGHKLEITLRGLENGSAGPGKTVTVSTTSDLPARTSSGFEILKGLQITQPTVSIVDPSPAAGARTRYVIGFTLSDTGGMSADANSRITLTLPGDTGTNGWLGGTVRDVTAGRDVGSCSVPDGQRISSCGFFSGASAPAGHRLEIDLRGLSNGAAGSGRTVTVSTTSDLPGRPSSGFEVVPGNALTGVTVTVGSTAPLASTQYTVELTTSATGGLSTDANSRVTLTFPAGTGFAGFQSGSLLDVDRSLNVGSCGSPSGTVVTCTLFSGAFVTAGDRLRISFPSITNPPSAGPYALTASTTSDIPDVTSSPYATPAPPQTTIDEGPSGAIDDSTPTFRFSSSTSGATFGCRVDDGAFAGCSSPYTTPTLADGPHTFEVRATSPAGVVDPTPAAQTFTVDTHAPASPAITAPADDSAQNTRTIELSGTAEPAATIEVREGAASRGATTADGSGNWTLELTSVPEGTHAYTATATDSAGNTSGPSAPRTITVDLTAPAAPVITDPADGSAQNSQTIELSGTGEPGVRIDILEGSAPRGTAVPDGDGHWSHTLTSVPEGTHDYTARATDAAGNLSPNSAPRTVTVDLTAPDAPVIDEPDEGAILTSSPVTFRGTAEAGSTIVIEVGDVRATVDAADGTWSVDLPIADGTHTYTATATDRAGNVSAPSAQRTITVDTGAPAAPVITSPAEGSTQNTDTVELSGTAEPGLTVEVREGDATRGTTTVDVQGNWTSMLGPVPDGAHTYTAIATDAAGHPSPPSAPRTITVDTQVPEPTIQSGPSGETTDTTASFVFSAEDGTAFECRLVGPAGSGDFAACTSPRNFDGLTPGNYTFSLRAKDAAGNETTRSRSFTVAPAQQQSPPDQPPPPPPPPPTATPTPTVTPPPVPEFKKTVVAEPVRGTVRVKLRGSKRFVELDATQGVPFGATLDTKKGAIELTSLSKAGAAPQTATFSRGIFRVTQKGSFTNLTLTERLACAKKPRASASARKKAKKVKTRRLWGSGKGKFRTTGRYSAATVRGTRWLVQDTCTTTVTRVTQGVVAVRDKVKRKTITLRKGKRYTAKKRR